jgi:hypothetical protein
MVISLSEMTPKLHTLANGLITVPSWKFMSAMFDTHQLLTHAKPVK